MKRSDIRGFTIGPIEIVFCKRRLVCIAITIKRGQFSHTYRPIDR